MLTKSAIQGIVLLVYLLLMVFIGFLFYKKDSTNTDYLLGDRKMNVWVTSMSAQASDMSGWLLMGLPGLAYLMGAGFTEAAWTAIGLAIGTYLNWLIVAKPLRKYTQKAGNAITLPAFLQNRFKSKSNLLRIFSAAFILIFFAVYTSSMFAAGAKLFTFVFNMDYMPALILSVVVVTVYTFLGGFKAVCWTDLFQGILMFFAIMFVCLIMFGKMNAIPDFSWSQLDVTLAPSSTFGIMGIVGAIAWGAGYFGQPHILARFMAINSPKEIKPARRIAMVWVILSLAGAVLLGMMASSYLPTPNIAAPEAGNEEKIFMILVQGMFPTVIAGILLSAVLAAIMSTADSQLLVASSAFSTDIYKTVFNKEASDKKLVSVSRITIIVIAIIAFLLAIDPNSSVFEIVSHAWAGFGAAFGPIVLCSLFWNNCNEKGAAAGVISGGAVALMWAYLPNLIWGAGNAPAIFSVYEIVPGFIVSLALIFIVSIATGGASKEIKAEFAEVKTMND
jgi:sodium/proline symporter